MNKITCSLIFILISTSATQAQFNFHWAFPYYADQNMEVKNENKNILVLTTDENQNGFKKAEKRRWSEKHEFHYVLSVQGIIHRSYKYICTDGTTSVADLKQLHSEMPKNVLFFVHRTKLQWPEDLVFLEQMLQERPGWAYGGDPYDPKTPVIRSAKSIFTENQILLGNQAPGEGL